jgi:hypothetical protein
VAIHPLFQRQAFGPEEIDRLAAAYETALETLHLPNRPDPVTEVVARRIIEIAQTGVRDPAKICDAAIKQLGVP